MLTIKKSELKITTKEMVYDDWRDWFILDKPNQIQDSYKTKLKIYFDSQCVDEVMIPININKLNCDLEVESNIPLTINAVRYVIPEMGIIRECSKKNITIHPGDTLNFSGEFKFYE